MTLRSLYSLRDRDRLRVEIEPRQQVHRRRHVVLRHLAGGDQVGHRRQDVRAVDAVALRAEHEVVARRAPRGLLGDLDIGHAVLGEEALLLGDDERRGVDQRDVAEDRLGHLRARRVRDMHAAQEARLGGGDDSRRAACGLEERAPAQGALCPSSLHARAGHFASSSFAVRVDLDRSPPSRSSPPKTKTPHSEVAHRVLRESGVAYGWPVFEPSGSVPTDAGQLVTIKLRANSRWRILLFYHPIRVAATVLSHSSICRIVERIAALPCRLQRQKRPWLAAARQLSRTCARRCLSWPASRSAQPPSSRLRAWCRRRPRPSFTSGVKAAPSPLLERPDQRLADGLIVRLPSTP